MSSSSAARVAINTGLRAQWATLISSDFVRKVAQTFLNKIILLVLGVFTSVLLARTLGAEGRGMFVVAATVGALGVQFGNLGLHASNTYYVARERESLPLLLGNSLAVGFGFGALIAVILGIVFLLRPQLAPASGVLLLLALAWIPFGLAYLLCQNLLLGLYEVGAYNRIELAGKLFGAVLLVALLVTRTMAPINAFLTTLVAQVLALGWLIVRLLRCSSGKLGVSAGMFRKNFGYGLRAYAAALFGFAVLRIDMLLMKEILGAQSVGYYSAAVNLADLFYLVPVTISGILFPKLSSLCDVRQKWRFTLRVMVLCMVPLFFFILIAALFTDQTVRLLFGRDFIPAVPAFRWLVPGILALSATSIISAFIASIDIKWSLIAVYIAATVLNIILNILLLPRLGIVAASMASTVAYGLCFVGVFLIAGRMRSTIERIVDITAATWSANS